MFHEILRSTPVYKEVFEEGRQEGIQEGRQEGIQLAIQLELERLRQAALNITLERFPNSVRPIKNSLEAVQDPAILLHIIVKLTIVQTADEAILLIQNFTRGDE